MWRPYYGNWWFLNYYLQYILQQATLRILNQIGILLKPKDYGKLEPDTYQLAVSNMLISSGHMFENLDRGDSIRDPITRKFDNVLANPPFELRVKI